MQRRIIVMLSGVMLSGVMLFGICAVSALAQTHDHSAMAEGDGQFNPFVAADPRGGFYLVYVERASGASNVMLRRSADGQNFSNPIRVNDRAGDAVVRNENPPKVMVAPNGDVDVCWASERGRWKGDIRFARSTDSGKTFAPAITLNSDAADEPAGHAFQSIAVDARGCVFVAWIDERNKQPEDRGAEIWLSTSEDGGKTFSHDHKILADVCECCRTNLQVDSTGKLFLSYRTVPAQGAMLRDIIAARSDDGGKTFTQTAVSHDGWEINGCPVAGPALNIDKSDRVMVVWFVGSGARPGLYYATSSNHGASYTPRQLLDPDQKLGKHAHAVNGADGQVIVAWDDATDKTLTVWGVLDINRGKLRRIGVREGASYPVVAARDRSIVITGMQTATHDLLLLHQKLE